MLSIRSLALSSLIPFLIVGCNPSPSSDGGDTGISPTMQGPPEAAYCSTLATYSPSVTVSGNARYIRREQFGTTMGAPGSAGLGSASLTASSHPASAHPIRYAEVRVTNSGGGLVTCTETDASGNFSFTLPQGGANYSVMVSSRSLNSHLHASVLNGPESNTFYQVGTQVSGASNTSGVQITATADGDVLGGAFNILDQLLEANIFLQAQVGTCSSTFGGCLNYDPTAHKIAAYWKKGFNPNSYFDDPQSGLSFYLPGYSRLFILGGIDGDVNSSDTDHFDASIIIHEYGHFLEDTWFETDSPGGMHSGDEILDPRLAWSEGWGDFFQAAVQSDGHYIDTMGNVDGSTEMIYYVDTETVSTSSFDYTPNSGEGNFREFAITRLLYDAVDSNSDSHIYPDASSWTDNISGAFNQIWAALTKSTNGYRDSRFAFRNVGLLHLSQIWMQNNKVNAGDSFASNWAQIRGLNRHLGDTSRYGQALIPSAVATGGGGSCAGSGAAPSITPSGSSTAYYFQITPGSSSGDSGSLATSNLFLNNRFYHLKIASSPFAVAGAHTLKLQYEDDSHSGTVADLDLYLYNTSARFAVQSDIIRMSRENPNSATAVSTETVTTTLPAGDYLINVNVYTGSTLGTAADFNLILDGKVLCPYDLVQ